MKKNYMKKLKNLPSNSGVLLLITVFFGQFIWSQGNFTGNIESTFQYLNDDPVINAIQPPSKGLVNSYMNVFYTNSGFKAGMRLESYLPRIQGYPNRFDGTGLGMRYVGYSNSKVDVTLGHFYEQFGNGLALRAYEDRALGYDNVLDGARIIFKPFKGIQIKGVYGQQRLSFEAGRVVNSDGIVRGIDADIHLNETFAKLSAFPLDVILGGSFVSKYQIDDDDQLILPENVGAYGGRMKLQYKNFRLDGEYIQKEQDPSLDNGKIYNFGHAAVVNFGYSKKGIGFSLSAKSVDNMSYRSDRNKELQDVFINYLPALNKTHTYNLVATLYPYATQPLGEVAYQADFLYTIKKGSKLELMHPQRIAQCSIPVVLIS
jgi:adhesin HecA-like repeat protein